jgi:hypothetical protein
MKGKCRPPDINFKRLLQFFNTPGDEIAPGSDVIGKYFQNIGLGHDKLLLNKNGAVHGE